jgi:2'-5' RNA ligase
MRYFIAALLHDEPKWRIDALREHLATQFGVKEALKIPPHITLYPPFETEDVSVLLPALKTIADQTPISSVGVTGFNHFDDRVWFVDVDQSAELHALKNKIDHAVHETVKLIGVRRPERPNHFHITLATKDVTPEAFQALKAFLASEPLPFSALPIDNITLLRHDDHLWTPARSFPFPPPTSNL